MVSLPPAVITGTSGSVGFSDASGGQRVAQVKVANRSPFALRVQLGSDEHWLDPWTADVFYGAGAKTLSYQPAILIPLGGSSQAQGALLVTLALGQECIPGTYPCQLSPSDHFGSAQLCRITMNGNTGVSRTYTIPIAGGTVAKSVAGAADVIDPAISLPVPATMRGIAVIVENGSNSELLSALGTLIVSAVYPNGNLADFWTTADQLPSRGYVVVPVDLASAQSIRLSMGPVSPPVNVQVYAVTDLQAVQAIVAAGGIVTIAATAGGAVIDPRITQTNSTAPLDRALAIARFDATVNNGATSSLVAGVSNQRVYLYRFQIVSLTTAPGFYWELQDDGSGSDFLRFGNELSADYAGLMGVSTGTGAGVQLKNISGANLRVAGTLHYVQA